MRFYEQTNQFTGAAAALLMALHEYAPEEWLLDKQHEFIIWLQSANLPTRSSSIYALGLIAQQAGLTARIIVEEKEYDYPDYRFKRYKKQEIDDAKFASKIYADKALAAGVSINQQSFTLQDVKNHILAKRLVLLRVNAGIFREEKATSRYALVWDYDVKTTQFHIMDPKRGLLTVDEETLQDAFETLVTKKKRDHRMLVLEKHQ